MLPEPDEDEGLPVRYCVDWAEQHHHVSGAVGRALAERLLALRWLRRPRRGGAVQLTDAGRAGLRAALGIDA